MTSPSLSKKLQRNLHLKSHLVELEALTGRLVLAEELGTAEEFVVLQQSAQKFIDLPITTCEIPFLDRNSERFKKFLQRLKDVNPSPIYIFTPYAVSCGALLVPSLDAIKFNFDFAINEDGIIVLATSDMSDRLLLDFSSTSTGEQRLTIETQGPNWSKVAY